MAKELGCTHAELMRRLSAREWAEWVAYYQLEAKEAAERMRKAKQKAGKGGG